MAKVKARANSASGSSKYLPAFISVGRPESNSKRVGAGRPAAVRIDAAVDPELYASTLLAKGVALNSAGDFQQALSCLQASLDFHIRLYGKDHASIIDCQLHLAEAQRRLDKFSAAHATIEAAVQRARAGKGASSIQLGLVLNELAALALHQNNLIAAVPAAEESRRLLEDAVDPHRTLPMDTLARAHIARGQLAEARALYEQMLPVDANTLLQNSHPRYIAHLHNQATVLQALGEVTAAARAFKKVAELVVQLYGDSFPDLSAVYANLGRLEQGRKHFDDAEEYFEKALEVSEKLGKKHAGYGYDLANLGRLALDRDDPKTAQGFLRNALSAYASAFEGKPHPYTASALTFLSYAQLALKKADEAKKSIEQAIQMWQQLAALCDNQLGDAGACDRAFAKVLLDCTNAACQSKQAAPVLMQSCDSTMLKGKLQKGDIRHRLLGALAKKKLIEEDKAARNSVTASTDVTAAAP
jgi:tetratricopeptide (TPR) repeat protein